jgi:hypothetical protein
VVLETGNFILKTFLFEERVGFDWKGPLESNPVPTMRLALGSHANKLAMPMGINCEII